MAQFGDGMELKRHDLSYVLLLGEVALHTVIPNPHRQAVPLVMELLLIEIPARFVRAFARLPLRFAGGRLRYGQRERTASRDIDHRQRRNL
jgi:hypothetical protein